MKTVKIIQNQGKSISTYQFKTKKEAVFFIDELKNKKVVQRIRPEHLYIVII